MLQGVDLSAKMLDVAKEKAFLGGSSDGWVWGLGLDLTCLGFRASWLSVG